MLFLQFYMDEARYVIATRNVVEVIPMVKLQALPQVPPFVAGLLCYRGQSVPVIDLCQLLLNRACNHRLSSRIVVVKARHKQVERVIGLLMEKATEARKIDEVDFVDSGIDNPATPYMAGVARDHEGLIQRITTDSLLSEPEFDLLFSTKDEARVKTVP